LLSLSSNICAENKELRAAFEKYQVRIQMARINRPLEWGDAFFNLNKEEYNALHVAFIYDLTFIEFFQRNFSSYLDALAYTKCRESDTNLSLEQLVLLANPLTLRRKIQKLKVESGNRLEAESDSEE
jgi:hypothetical protein